MSFKDQSQSLTLDGHIIDCSGPIYDGSKNLFHAEDDQKLEIVVKRVYTDNSTQLQRSFERAQDLNS